MSVLFKYGLILFSLISGLTIYLLWRDTSSHFYQWAVQLGVSELIDSARSLMSTIDVSGWFVYSLPDGLWMFAFVLFMMAVWDFQMTGHGRFWIIISVIVGISFEIFQALVSGMGAFDWVDMLFMTIGAGLPLLLFKKNQVYEKVL